jgi:putative nucleotidyltransferase with HDIG domain
LEYFSMPTLTIEQLVQSVQELPSLPQSTVKVLKMTDDANASAREVAAVISADLSLTSRVLRIANSAYYGLSRSVSTVNDAVIILGMQAVRNLALAAASYDTLRQELPGYGLPPGVLWRHSLACACAAQVLAKHTRVARAEEAFDAGLLHDVGKVVLSVHVGPQFEAIRALTELDNLPFHEGERLILGFDHAEVGAQVAEKWNLPPSLCSAIAGHHVLDRGADFPELTALTYMANLLCASESGTLGLITKIVPDEQAMDVLGLTEMDLDSVMTEVYRQLEQANPVL